MAAPYDVLTLAEAKQALNNTATTKYDAELEFYITATSEALDRLVGPVVQRAVVGEAHDGGGVAVYLTLFPVVSVDSVDEYADGVALALTRELGTAAAPTDGYSIERYVADAALFGGRVERRKSGKCARFAEGSGNVVVSYTAGRAVDTASVPALYKHAAGLMIQNYWRAQTESSGGVGEFDVPQSYFPRWAVPQAVKQLLADELQQPRQLLA